MEITLQPSPSPSPSSSTSSSTPRPGPPSSSAATTADHDPMHSWWESVSKQRSSILSLSTLLPSDHDISSLADSDRPALSFLSSSSAYYALSSALSSPTSGSGSGSGSGSNPLCHWLYDTFLSSDPHLRLIVLSFLPLLSGLYLSRLHSSTSSPSLPSLSGFEAVLLAVYSSEVKSRAGKPLLVHVPDLSQPSLYHTPRNRPGSDRSSPSIGVLSPPLEPQVAVKSTKRATIVGTAFDCYHKSISQMPAWSKLEFCRFSADWAGQDCPCGSKLDDNSNGDRRENRNGHGVSFENGSINGYEDESEIESVVSDMEKLAIENGEVSSSEERMGVRIPLPWELLRPVVTILGHCLFGPSNSQEVKDAASVAVRRLYARASHDLTPQPILALQSLIRLDNSAREAVRSAARAANSSSNANTPSKAKKPEILLVSK